MTKFPYTTLLLQGGARDILQQRVPVDPFSLGTWYIFPVSCVLQFGTSESAKQKRSAVYTLRCNFCQQETVSFNEQFLIKEKVPLAVFHRLADEDVVAWRNHHDFAVRVTNPTEILRFSVQSDDLQNGFAADDRVTVLVMLLKDL
jgi:hypothetical protein